ncbi:phosphatidate cytidylyltransferase [Candidatus Magnetoovum chiemensis]|nr:phosphatidate cytidylyltransferase [Candidatus Magnetoovum chiemensis]
MQIKRVAVAVLVLPIVYLYIMRLSAFYFAFFVFAVSFIAYFEFLSMYKVRKLYAALFSLFGVIAMSYMFFRSNSPYNTHLLSCIFLGAASVRLFAVNDTNNALRDIGVYLIGFLYIPMLMIFFLKLRLIGAEVIIYFLAVMWGADSFALYMGKFFGKHKLYEAVSPNKTIEGAVAALLGGIAISMILGRLLDLQLSYSKLFINGLVLSAAGIIGDLAESMFKRDAGVKDSSAIIPGHGGILDKIDGMLFASPILYILLKT